MLLAIDTATLQASVALLAIDGTLLATRRARVTTHSEQLLPLVRDVLADAGATVQSLSAIACGAGPGSFTGLRIGLATAKGLCLATGRPLLLVSSLAALALRGPKGALVVGAIDAFKGEVYAGFYARGDGDALVPEGDEAVLSPDALARRLADAALHNEAHTRRPVHLVGDVLRAWPVLAVPGVDTSDAGPPEAVEVGRLALSRFLRGETDDLSAAVPAYIRASEAEIRGPRLSPPKFPHT